MEHDNKDNKMDQALVDIRDVQIDAKQPQEEKIRSFIEQIKDPYRFKVGNVTVQVSYSGGNASLDDRFAEMMSLLA